MERPLDIQAALLDPSFQNFQRCLRLVVGVHVTSLVNRHNRKVPDMLRHTSFRPNP